MPYKQKLKTPSLHPRSKTTYKVTNWRDYNKSLQKRGELSLYFPKGDIKSYFINEDPYVSGMTGQQSTYKQPYVELIYLFYRLFRWGMRQIKGYFEDIWRVKKLEIPVPSFGHLSDLFSTLPVRIKQFCDKLVQRVKQGEPVSLILDSTGMRFDKAGHWYETKYGLPCKQTPWRKLHLSIDPDMNIHGIDITEREVSDQEMLAGLLFTNEDQIIEKVIADGAYYSIEGVEHLYKQGIIPVIPPQLHSGVHNRPNTVWHDKIVNYIKEKGTIYAFHKKYGYGVRSLVEAQISRIKRCIGAQLKTQKIESQRREGIIIANIINQWNAFGKCISVKTG